MTKLSVNVNKIATLRNARGKDLPNVLHESQKIIGYGAQGITVHPRPDGRHIRWTDVWDLKKNISVEFNIEGYPSDDFIQKVLEVEPEQCTLVPDPPEVLTSNAGWKVIENQEFLTSVIEKLKQKNIRLSFFIDPHEVEMKELLLLRDMGADRIELYTESYADAYGTAEQNATLQIYQKCAQVADSMGLGVNAGHDLNLLNLKHFAANIPELKEVSIGHALVSDALELGWQETVKRYLNCLIPSTRQQDSQLEHR